MAGWLDEQGNVVAAPPADLDIHGLKKGSLSEQAFKRHAKLASSEYSDRVTKFDTPGFWKSLAGGFGIPSAIKDIPEAVFTSPLSPVSIYGPAIQSWNAGKSLYGALTSNADPMARIAQAESGINPMAGPATQAGEGNWGGLAGTAIPQVVMTAGLGMLPKGSFASRPGAEPIGIPILEEGATPNPGLLTKFYNKVVPDLAKKSLPPVVDEYLRSSPKPKSKVIGYDRPWEGPQGPDPNFRPPGYSPILEHEPVPPGPSRLDLRGQGVQPTGPPPPPVVPNAAYGDAQVQPIRPVAPTVNDLAPTYVQGAMHESVPGATAISPPPIEGAEFGNALQQPLINAPGKRPLANKKQLANQFEPGDQSQLGYQDSPGNYEAGPTAQGLQGPPGSAGLPAPPSPYFTEYSFNNIMEMLKQKALFEKLSGEEAGAAGAEAGPDLSIDAFRAQKAAKKPSSGGGGTEGPKGEGLIEESKRPKAPSPKHGYQFLKGEPNFPEGADPFHWKQETQHPPDAMDFVYHEAMQPPNPDNPFPSNADQIVRGNSPKHIAKDYQARVKERPSGWRAVVVDSTKEGPSKGTGQMRPEEMALIKEAVERLYDSNPRASKLLSRVEVRRSPANNDGTVAFYVRDSNGSRVVINIDDLRKSIKEYGPDAALATLHHEINHAAQNYLGVASDPTIDYWLRPTEASSFRRESKIVGSPAHDLIPYSPKERKHGPEPWRKK